MDKAASSENQSIVFVAGSLPPIRCGVGIYSKLYIEHLIANNFKVNLVTSGGVDAIDGVSSSHTVSKWSIFRLPSIVRYVNGIDATIVHIQYPAVGYKRNLGINLLPLSLRIFTSKKTIITLHEYYASRKIGRIRNLLTCLFANKIVVSNQADLDALPNIIRKKAKVIYIASNIAVVPNDKQKWQDLLHETGLSESKKTLLFFGFPHKSKNIPAIIDAVKELENFQLLLLSDLRRSDDYENRLLELANRLPSKVGIGGFKDDVTISIALHNTDYFVLPQSAPLTPKSSTALAALVHGTPIISTKSNEANVNAPFIGMVNCYLLEEIDLKSISALIKKADLDPQLQEKVRENAREISKQFTWETVLDKYLIMYAKNSF